MTAPRVPPKFVPTLTEVVRRSEGVPSTGAEITREERIVQRVMQRLDAELEQRLREAVASLVVEQTRALGPRLREDIEASVREAVAEALAQERRSS
jgi:hypothetical protein